MSNTGHSLVFLSQCVATTSSSMYKRFDKLQKLFQLCCSTPGSMSKFSTEGVDTVCIFNIPIVSILIYSALLVESSKPEYLQVTNLASYESTFYNNIVVCKFIQPMHITQIIITCNTRLLLFCTLLLSDVGNTLTSSVLSHTAREYDGILLSIILKKIQNCSKCEGIVWTLERVAMCSYSKAILREVLLHGLHLVMVNVMQKGNKCFFYITCTPCACSPCMSSSFWQVCAHCVCQHHHLHKCWRLHFPKGPSPTASRLKKKTRDLYST